MEVPIFLFFSGKTEGIRKIWRIFPQKVFSKHFSRNHQILQISKKKEHYTYVNINNIKKLNIVRITGSILVHVLQIINKLRRMKNSYMERSYPIIPGKNPFQTPPELLCRSYDFGAFCPQFSQCTLRELKVLQELTLPQNFQPYPCRSHATRKGKGKQSLIHILSFIFHVSWPDFPQK